MDRYQILEDLKAWLERCKKYPADISPQEVLDKIDALEMEHE